MEENARNIITPFDADNLVEPRQTEIGAYGEYDYSMHGSFLKKCDSYGEYLLKCCIDGIEPIITETEFNDIKAGNLL